MQMHSHLSAIFGALITKEALRSYEVATHWLGVLFFLIQGVSFPLPLVALMSSSSAGNKSSHQAVMAF